MIIDDVADPSVCYDQVAYVKNAHDPYHPPSFFSAVLSKSDRETVCLPARPVRGAKKHRTLDAFSPNFSFHTSRPVSKFSISEEATSTEKQRVFDDLVYTPFRGASSALVQRKSVLFEVT